MSRKAVGKPEVDTRPLFLDALTTLGLPARRDS
jgi:hypothetical protein